MKYLHGFNLDTQFKNEYNDDEKYFEPWTSLTHENEEVHYNKKQAGEYLTFEILTGGELYLGEILYSELINAFENTIKNEDSNSNDYMYIDKLNNIIGVNEDNYPGSDTHPPIRLARTRALKYYDFLQEFPTLPGIKYSINGGEWTDWLINPETYYRTLTVSSGDIVRIKGDKRYINIFEGNDSWIDPRDIDNSIAKEVTRQSDTTTKDITITIDHQDIDFDSSIFGNLSDINSWYNSDLFSNLEEEEEFDSGEEEEEEEENPVLPKNSPKRNGAIISNFSTSINGNVFSYKGKIKYKFKNVTFNKINPTKLEEDTLINTLIGYTYDGEKVSSVSLIMPKALFDGGKNNYIKKLLQDGVIKYSDIISINDSDDPHIKYLSYNLYNQESYYTYTYYTYHENFTNTYIGLSVFGFLLFDDNENLIGFASINDSLEIYNNIYDFLLPEKYFKQYIVDYIYNNDFSSPLEIVFNPEYFVPGYPGGGNPKRSRSFPSIVENSNWLFVFTYDEKYLNSLLDKYKFDDGIDYILRNKRFNFRSSDTCTFNVRGSIASIYYGDEFEGKINFKTEALYAGLFYHCDGLISCKNLVLPGYFLSPECYLGMFSYCSNLEETFSNFYNGITCEETAFAYMFFKCTSLTKTVEFPDTELYPNLFLGMYYGCSSLTDIIGIEPYTLIPKGCFSFTFSKCDSLETIPDISSFNTIGTNGCLCMFSNCSGLVEISNLHFHIVYEFGVAGMFYSCSNLETIGSIVFDNIYYNGAEKMFSKCINLVNTESVYCNNSNSYDYCYAYMFSECTSLVNPPELPQQKLSPYCYYKMFYKCINLLSAPALNATTGKCGNTSNYVDYYDAKKSIKATKGNNSTNSNTILNSQFLSPGCYESMFEDCILLNCNITLPADKVYNRAYYKMFKNCSSLINMPLILAKEVGDYGFAYMFSNCTSLSQVTSLNGQIAIHGNSGYNEWGGGIVVNSYGLLSSTKSININSIDNEKIIGYNYFYGSSSGKGAYSNMFEYCTSLTTMPDLNVISFAEAMCYKMFYNCTSLRTVKNLYPLKYSISCFSNMFENCISITSTPTINYNIDLEDFFDEYPSDDYTISHDLMTGLRYMCSSEEEFENLDLSDQGILDYLFYNANRYTNFSYIFYETFKNCTSLTTINNIYIYYPYDETFRSTFENCTSLVNINNFIYIFDINERPDKIFTDRGYIREAFSSSYIGTIGNGTFYKMFYNCTSLIRVPIDFIKFSNYGSGYQIFESMFENCTLLIQAPEILDNSNSGINHRVFYRMFKNCISLPEVKINILNISNKNEDSFTEMFYNCSSLNKIYTKFRNTAADILQYEFSNWVYGVSSTGIFYEDFNYPWDERGVSYIPENWEIIYYGLNLVNSEDSNIFLSLEGDTYDIEIYSENSWSITSSPDWLTTNIVNNGNRYYTLTISASLASLDRSGTLILVDNVTNETLEILIYQTSGMKVEYIEVPGSTSTVTLYKIETNFRLAQNQNYKIIISYYIPKLVDSLGIFRINGMRHYLAPTSSYFKYYQIRFQNGDPNSNAIIEQYNNYDSASYGANIINCLLTSESQGYGSYYKYNTGLSSPRNSFPYESFDSFTTSGSTRYYQNYIDTDSNFPWENEPLTIFYTNNPFGGTRLYGIKIYTGDNYSTVVFDGVPYVKSSNNITGLFDKVSLQFYTPTTS